MRTTIEKVLIPLASSLLILTHAVTLSTGSDTISASFAQNFDHHIKLSATRVKVNSKAYANDPISNRPQITMTQLMSDTDEISTEQGTVMLDVENQQNYAYTAELYIGTPPQPIQAIFDTGSANAWIISSEAVAARDASRERDEGANDYNLTASESAIVPEQEDQHYVTIHFGSGQLEGYFIKDHCLLGDPEDPSNQMVVREFEFGYVTEETVFSGGFDAIIGLAYPSMAEKDIEPFFDAMIREGVLDQNLFAFYMSMNPYDDDSELTFGYYDTSRFTGDVTWHTVVDKLFWSLNLTDVLIDGQSLGVCDDKDCMITPDSGTSLLTMPGWAHKTFMSTISDVNEKPCSEGQEYNFGNMTFVIDGKSYDVPSHHWMERKIDPDSDQGSTCSTTVGVLDIRQEGQENLFIVGDAFMQIFYSIFDRDNDQVGLALASHPTGEVIAIYDVDGEL